jgi:hypothetical protein
MVEQALRSSHGEGWHHQRPAPMDGAVDDVGQYLLWINHFMPPIPIGGFH